MTLRDIQALATLLACKPCCGGGSGSGSGGSSSGSGSGGGGPDTSCGGCDWDAVPSLECSVYISCLAETFTLTLTGTAGGFCTKVYSGTVTSGAGGTGSGTSCEGDPASDTRLYETSVSVEMACVDCVDDSETCTRTVWLIGVDFNSIKGGVYRVGLAPTVLGAARLAFESCSPVSFAQKRIDYICNLDIPPTFPVMYDCCGAGDPNLAPPNEYKCHDYGYASTQETDGCYVLVDITE